MKSHVEKTIDDLSEDLGRPSGYALANGHPGPRGLSLAHLPRGYDPQQPLHAQVGKYSNTILLLSMILINHDRLGTDWHLSVQHEVQQSPPSLSGMRRVARVWS